MKRVIFLALCVFLIISSIAYANPMMDSKAKLFIPREAIADEIKNAVVFVEGSSYGATNGKRVALSEGNKVIAEPKNGSVLVPISFVAKGFGYNVSMNGNELVATNGTNTIKAVTGENVIYKNGTPIQLKIVNELKEGEMMCAVDELAQAFDKKLYRVRELIVISNKANFFDGSKVKYYINETIRFVLVKEIKVAPKLTELRMNGELIAEFSNAKNQYTVRLPYGTTNIPEITAMGEGKVEVKQAEGLPGSATISSTDKKDAEVVAFYTVDFKVMPMTGKPKNATEIKIQKVDVSKVGDAAMNVLDGDLKTSWAAEGEQWISCDLGAQTSINYIAVAFLHGEKRQSKFDVEVSTDGENWEKVFKGQSSGVTGEQEIFAISKNNTRYVRVYGYGNTTNLWNNIAEIRVYK